MANILQTIYNLTPSIGTAFTTSTWTYAELGEGIDNVAEALNEVVQQYFYLSNNGFATNHVTGQAPAYTFTGKRVFGDAAQDYIFSKKHELGTGRDSSFKLEYTDNSGETPTTKTITCPCTIANIQEWSGGSTDDSSISFEIRFNGQPTVA